jgi:hypothetical protein
MAAAPTTGAFGAAPAPAPGPANSSALGPQGARAAQNTSFGETQLTGVGPIYKKQDSLEPVRRCCSAGDMHLRMRRLQHHATGLRGWLI